MKIRTKIETAIELRDSIEMNRDLAKDGLILFNRRFPHYQEEKATRLSEMVTNICEYCRDMPPLTGTPMLPTEPELLKVFQFVDMDVPANGIHVYSVEKTADRWAIMACVTPDEPSTVKLISTNDFEHFRTAGKITCTIENATVVYAKIHIVSPNVESLQIIYEANGIYSTAFCDVSHGAVTNAVISEFGTHKLLAVPPNGIPIWITYEENRDWSIKSTGGVLFTYFDYEAPVTVIDAEYYGKSLYITGVWTGATGNEYRVIKVEFGDEISAVINGLTIPTDPTQDMFGIGLYILNGTPYVVVCGTNKIYRLSFDDYSLIDEESAITEYAELSAPTDTSAIVAARRFEGSILLHTMNGLVLYNVTHNTWSEVAIPGLVTGYNGGLYDLEVSATDDLFLTASAIDNSNTNYGFAMVKLPFSRLPVKENLLGIGVTTFGPDNVIATGQNKVQDLRSWYSFKDPIFDHILTVGITTVESNAYFIALLDTNKLINIILPANGGDVTIEEYPELPLDFTESYLYFAQNNWHLTDGTSAYLIDVVNKTCVKSLETGNIPSAAAMPYFTSNYSVGRTYVYIDPFSCIFIEHNLVENSSTAYYFTGNGVMQTLALTATLKINGVDDLFVTARRAGEFWFSATINSEPKSIAFSSIANATYDSWDAFETSQVPVESWEVKILKDEGYGIGGYMSDTCLFGPAGIFSIGSNGELHRFTNAVTYFDVSRIVDIDDYHKLYCGFSLNDKTLCYSHESQSAPYLSRGTIKVHSLMKDAFRNTFTLTIPIAESGIPAIIFFESRDFNGSGQHTRIRAYCPTPLYSMSDMMLMGEIVKGYILTDDGETATAIIPENVTCTRSEDLPRYTIEFTLPADSPLLMTDLLEGDMLDYYVIGYTG